MKPALYASILVVQQQCQMISYFLICLYFFSNGKKLLEKSKHIGNFLKIVCILSTLVFIIIFIYEVA